MSQTGQERKKRKFDLGPPPTPDVATNTSAPPEAALQLINQQLNTMIAQTGVDTTTFDKEIEINDLRADIRYHLCKGLTHEELLRDQVGKSTIKVRGKYKGPGDTTSERSLHLYISSDTREHLDSIVSQIYEIISKQQDRPQSIDCSFLMVLNL